MRRKNGVFTRTSVRLYERTRRQTYETTLTFNHSPTLFLHHRLGAVQIEDQHYGR